MDVAEPLDMALAEQLFFWRASWPKIPVVLSVDVLQKSADVTLGQCSASMCVHRNRRKHASVSKAKLWRVDVAEKKLSLFVDLRFSKRRSTFFYLRSDFLLFINIIICNRWPALVFIVQQVQCVSGSFLPRYSPWEKVRMEKRRNGEVAASGHAAMEMVAMAMGKEVFVHRCLPSILAAFARCGNVLCAKLWWVRRIGMITSRKGAQSLMVGSISCLLVVKKIGVPIWTSKLLLHHN